MMMKRVLWIACAASLAVVLPAACLSAGEPLRSYELIFSTYFGGSGGELLRDMTADAQGNIYAAGTSGSADLPKTHSDLPGQTPKDGAMVAKLTPGGALAWSRLCGTGKEIYFYTVKVDGAGFVYVAGRMGPGFPTTPGAFQPTTQHVCGFMGKLKPDASAWVWATYVGTGYAVRDMAMDDKGDLYGILDYFAESKEALPAAWFAGAFQKTPHGGGNHFGRSDAGVIKVSGDGKVLWATWIGGANGQRLGGVSRRRPRPLPGGAPADVFEGHAHDARRGERDPERRLAGQALRGRVEAALRHVHRRCLSADA